MKKRILASLLSLAMLFALLPVSAFAADGDLNTGEEGTTLAEPAGTESDPFIISSSTFTNNIAFAKSGYYRLTEDVTAGSIWGSTDANATVTLDLAGHSITQSSDNTEYAFVYIDSDLPNLTIVNTGAEEALLKSTNNVVSIQLTGENPKLTLGQGVTLDNSGVTDRDTFAILVAKDVTSEAEVNLNGCTIKDANGITVNGLCEAATKITLNGATIEASDTTAIYQAGKADSSDVNIADSTSPGASTGIEIRAGDLTLTNSTVTGGNGDLTVNPNGGGTTTENAAVAVSQHVTAHDINVNLSGNVTLNSKTALSIANPQNNTTGTVKVDIAGGIYNGSIVKAEDATNATLTITGGTFNEDVSDYVPENTYQCTASGDKWVVEPYVAKSKVTFQLATGVILKDVTNATAVTGTPEVYTVTDAAKPVTFKLEAPENSAIDVVKAGDTVLTAADGVYTIPALTKDVTVTATTKTTVQDPATLTISLPNETEATEIAKMGKTVAELQTEIVPDGLKVTGTSNYVQEFTSFNGNDQAEQQGNYIALKLTASDGTIPIQYKSKNGNAQGYKTLDANGLLVWRLSVATDTGKINPIHVKLGNAEYDIDLTGITLGLPQMPEPSGSGTTVTNDLTSNTQVAEDIKNTIANVTTGNVDDAAENTPDVTNKDVTITFSGKTDSSTNGGSVKLGSSAVSALKNEDATGTAAAVNVSAAVETNVADVVLPSGALGMLDSNQDVEVSVAKKAAADISTAGMTTDQQTLVQNAETIADVTVKQGSTETFDGANLTGDSMITIVIKVDASKKDTLFQVLHINGSTLTKMLSTARKPEGNDTDGYYISVKTGHLSDFALVDATTYATQLAALDGTSNPGEVTLTYTKLASLSDAEKVKFYGGKLTIAGLEAGKRYVVTFDYGSAISGGNVPRAVVVAEADANGKVELSCQDSMKVTVQRTGSDNNVNAGTLTAIFYDPDATNQGVLVTNDQYITQK